MQRLRVRVEAMAGAQTHSVFVGNLDPEVSVEDLKAHMSAAGDVVFADILTDRSGQSKGFATVKYRIAEEAADAISSLSGSMLFDRDIFVREDRGKGGKCGKGGKGADSDGKGWRGGGGKGKDKGYGSDAGYGKGRGKSFGKFGSGDSSGPTPSEVAANKGRLVYVGNLPFRTAWQDVKDVFTEHGEVIRVDLPRNSDGRSAGYAMVLFGKEPDAQAAISALHERDFHGRNMVVRLDRSA